MIWNLLPKEMELRGVVLYGSKYYRIHYYKKNCDIVVVLKYIRFLLCVLRRNKKCDPPKLSASPKKTHDARSSRNNSGKSYLYGGPLSSRVVSLVLGINSSKITYIVTD